jgi:hypothetical protein
VTPTVSTPLVSAPVDVKKLADPRELPCRDMDLDCLTGEKPFGSYGRCYAYAPELGRCPLVGLEA